MKTAIVVTPGYDQIWPFAADRLREVLEPVTDLSFVRLADGDSAPLAEIVGGTAGIGRLILLGPALTDADLDAFPDVEELFSDTGFGVPASVGEMLEARSIRHLKHSSEGFWSQSVSEFALAITLAALRRIPQAHQAMQSGLDGWTYHFDQFVDDPRFTSGTVQGKRVRIVGAGNIASRYASFMTMLGADVAAWDPYAGEPAFHRSGARKEWFLDNLVTDAEIFVPMVPLLPSTRGLVTAEQIRALPDGCLVVQATRAEIVDTAELRRRVLANELSLAADVFDIEPVPLDDPLLGRSNVVHTPHIAGRTKESNYRWAEMLAEQFPEYDRNLVPAPAATRTRK